jgi:hypothetical protein
MNLSGIITALFTAWEASNDLADTTLYYHLAPEKTSGQFAVFRLGTVSPGEQTTGPNRDWQTTLSFTGFAASDGAILTLVDDMVDLLERGNLGGGIYSCVVESVEVELNYGDQQTPWSAGISVGISWTV